MQKFASVDIGSNTVRLLVMERLSDGQFREIDSERKITRLGEGMDKNNSLLPHRVENTIRVLGGFVDKCKKYGEIPIRVVATSAVREASNKEEFCKLAKENLGLTIEVIPWEEEARLTVAGALWKMENKSPLTLVFDIGGGSTEFIVSQNGQVINSAGTSLGVVRLTEKFIIKDPVDPDELSNLQTHLEIELASVKNKLGENQPETLLGTAGTVTTLAALHKNLYPYDPEKIHQTVLSLPIIEKIFDDLKGKSIEERKKLKPLESGREDLIIAGISIVLATMKTFSFNKLVVSEYSLREGILIDCFS
jgi:exopolyphosphatase/guanosine-5'-triphosphate,3'-diphosphate pyrophosphatase